MTQQQFDSLVWRVNDYPDELVKEVVYSIPESVIKNTDTTYADLAMGGGQFLKGILSRCVNDGQDKEQVLPRLYGFEQSVVYINYARWKNGLQGANLAILKPERDLDSLDMKFDVVVGNPPFQEVINGKRKDQASNLWTKFWLKSLELTTEDGLVSLITPTSWLSPSANLRGSLKYLGRTRLWDVFDSFTSVAQVSGLDRFFKGIGSSFGVVTVNKSGSEGLSFKEGYDTSLGFLPKSEIEEVILKINGKQTLGNLFSITQDCGDGWRVSTPLTRKVTDASVEILKDSETPLSGSSNSGLYLYTHVTSKAEAEQVREVILNARDILNVHCRWSGFMNIQIFKNLTVQ